MPKPLMNKRVAFLTANEGVEEVELTTPWANVVEAGAEPILMAPKVGVVLTMNHLDKSNVYKATQSVDDADTRDFDALVIPGGVANPDRLRMHAPAVQFVHDFYVEGKPMGVICHGAWMLVEADIVRGRRLTSWPSLMTDIRNAGGHWVNEEVVTDSGLVTSRKPDDLPAFCKKVIEEIVEGTHSTKARQTALAS
jgi:protease I